MSTTVGVLGGGPWGLALAVAARRAGSQVILHTRRRIDDLEGVEITQRLATLANARLIVLAVPSQLARPIARDLGDHLDGGHMLVHGIRGLSGDELMTVSEILREETPVRRLGALGGPVQASELRQGRPSAMVVGARFPDVAEALVLGLSNEALMIRTTNDLVGLEWASALVGCLSIGVGYVQSRPDVSPGLLAALISRAVDEAAAIASAAGANDRTLYGLGGYGDLLASMALPDRPEVVLGRALGRGANLEEAQTEAKLRVEAVELTPRIARFAAAHDVRCDVFTSMADILSGRGEPSEIVRALFA